MEIKQSTRKNKKYMVKYNNKWIHFGDTRYEQFMDKTPLKLYSNMDHKDDTRRFNYINRAMGIKDKNGNITANNPNSANFYALRLLW